MNYVILSASSYLQIGGYFYPPRPSSREVHPDTRLSFDIYHRREGFPNGRCEFREYEKRRSRLSAKNSAAHAIVSRPLEPSAMATPSEPPKRAFGLFSFYSRHNWMRAVTMQKTMRGKRIAKICLRMAE